MHVLPKTPSTSQSPASFGAFKIRPSLVNGVEAKVDSGNGGFLAGTFHISVAFNARFCPEG